MTSFLYNLKGQATLLNLLLALLILALLLSRFKKRKTANLLTGISIILFLLFSTTWLPRYLAKRLESKYAPLSRPADITDTGKVLIHVLGSGYTLDTRLPATAQIGLVALGRLTEGIRIHRSIKNSIIICSGFSPFGLETQAQVTKRAAIVLGIDSGSLETLNTPTTTLEEAKALGKRYDKSSKLIIVTDAIHMPRAMKLFKAEGFNPTAAPTNYKVTEGPELGGLKWWPSIDNLSLMNYVIHESLGNIKSSGVK